MSIYLHLKILDDLTTVEFDVNIAEWLRKRPQLNVFIDFVLKKLISFNRKVFSLYFTEVLEIIGHKDKT